MMANVKGCINAACVAHEKQTLYKDVDDYCSKCGNRLVYVCKKCHTQLPDSSKQFCEYCLAEKQDKTDRTLKKVGVIASGAAAVGIAAVNVGKLAIKGIAKLK